MRRFMHYLVGVLVEEGLAVRCPILIRTSKICTQIFDDTKYGNTLIGELLPYSVVSALNAVQRR